MAAPAKSKVVLVAVDSSDCAKAAFQWYLREVHKPDDFVIVCHIPEVPDLPSFTMKGGLNIPVTEWQKTVNESLDNVKHLEEYYGGELIRRKIQHKIKSESNRIPGQGIIATSEAEKARLVVVGTRGLDTIRRTVLGSVSDYVVHHSKVPVLICPKTEQ